MTPKEKAIELYLKYYHNMYAHWDVLECKQVAKGCVLIAVDEILEALPEDYQNDIWSYWIEVKKEIELL
jgi:hypothetical protein